MAPGTVKRAIPRLLEKLVTALQEGVLRALLDVIFLRTFYFDILNLKAFFSVLLLRKLPARGT